MFSCKCSISRSSVGERWLNNFAAQANCLAAGRHQSHEVNDRYDSAKLYNTTSANAVLKAGRELSSWILNTLPSPLPLSLFSTQGSELPSPTPFISTLPQEVLEEIFREYVHGDNTDLFSWHDPLTGPLSRIVTRFGATTTPITLAHVCASWRAIVMGNPTFWSKLCAVRAEPCDVPLFKYWLSLSASTPLEFEIIQRPESATDWDIDTAAHTLLSIFLEHSDRWKSVCLALTHDLEPLFTATGKLLPVPSLQSVDLTFSNWTPEGLRSLSTMLSASPLLRRVALGSIDQSSPFMSGLPWANMRQIEISRVSLLDLVAILRSAESLEHLSVNQVQGRLSASSSPEGSTPIYLPSLTTIDLEHCDDPPALLDMLSVPSLSTYSTMSGLDTILGTGSGWTAFHELAQRSGTAAAFDPSLGATDIFPKRSSFATSRKGQGPSSPICITLKSTHRWDSNWCRL
ncbi:hypothetical protein NMY22_g17930 [Coprinellus aureogranulatus]|nr:hypothetical protein NMY22_g17930 [Coprinellus aureogranulatus]